MKNRPLTVSWLGNDKKYCTFTCHDVTVNFAIKYMKDEPGEKLVSYKHNDMANQRFCIYRAGVKKDGHTMFYIATPKGNFVRDSRLVSDASNASMFWFEWLS